MITELSLTEAESWFAELPPQRQITTLSPAYVHADAARDETLATLFLGYREGDAFWLHGVHRGTVVMAPEFDDFQSPYGYGGPLCNYDAPAFLERAWANYQVWCHDHRILVEFVRLHPLAASWQPYFGEIRLDRSTIVVPLQVADLRANYEVRCRTAVRKAEQASLSVEIRPNEEITGCFASFYRDGMVAIGAEPYYLFDDAYFSALAQLPGVSLLVCARDGEWLAAGLFFAAGETLEYHLSATSALGRKLAATNLLLDAAAAMGRDRGLQQFYLGGGTDRRSDNPLLFFKAGFSSQRATFRFGFNIHQAQAYAALKDSYHQYVGNTSSRILFYRK